MRNTNIALLLTGVLCLSVTACGDKESSTSSAKETSSSAVETQVIDAAKTTDSESKAESPESKADAEAAQTVSGGSITAEDMSMTVGDVTLTLNNDTSSLPEAKNVEASPSCYYEGEDKILHYDDMEVYTYPSGDKDMILEVTLLNDKGSTAKGLKVGMTLDDAIAMYGTGKESGKMYKWETDSSYMYVYTDNGSITSIGMALNM